jgi:dihydrolipoamide dehydrogenase
MKIVVLGGGPGGYVAAIRAAQLGADVTLIEKNRLGGTCLNVGCIPTKVLLHTAEIVETMKHAQTLGIESKGISVNWGQLMSRKESVVDQLVGGVEGLLQSNQVTIINGTGKIQSQNGILITDGDQKGQVVEFDKCILAVGSVPSLVPIPGSKHENVITSDDALSLDAVPESMLIIGGGVIGTEFAEVYSSFGSDVTIVEMAESILPPIDAEISEILKGKLEEKQIKIIENARVERIEDQGMMAVSIAMTSGTKVIKAEKVLMAVGRRPSTDSIGLEEIGIKMNRGMIQVDSRMRTNLKNYYAIGDCNGGIMLAHVASAEGIVAVETIMGLKPEMDLGTVPSAVYTKPEIASVGMTEKEAVDAGYRIKVGRFPLMANGKALIMMEDGLVKIIADVETKEILGVHMIGPRATDIIAEAAIAMRLEATVEELITTIHAHPTVSEAVMEAGHGVFEHAIHLPK